MLTALQKQSRVKAATVISPLLMIITFILVKQPSWDELLKTGLVDLSIGIIAGLLGGYIFLLWVSRPPLISVGGIYFEDGIAKVKVTNDRKKTWFPHESANDVFDIHAEMHFVSSMISDDPEHSVLLELSRDEVILLKPGHERVFRTRSKIDHIKAEVNSWKVQWGADAKDVGLRFQVVCRDGLSNVPTYLHRKRELPT